MSDPNAHDPHNLPLVVLGTDVKGGRHVRYPGTPLTNLYISMLARVGVPIDHFGDSTGQLAHLEDL
jgi:hypothetical protein